MNDPDANIGDANSQNGTGSTDFLFNTMYTITVGKFGVNNSVNYKINMANPDQYQFGNRLTLSSIVYRRFRFAGMSVSPNLGLLYEHTAINHFSGDVVDQTGGYLLNASCGAELSFNKISVGINTQLPIKQNFAEGQTQSKSRGVLHISLAL